MSESNVPEIIKYLTEDNLKLMYGRLNRRYLVVDALPSVDSLEPADKNVIYVVKETVGETVRYWPNVLDNDVWKPFGIGQEDLDGKADKADAVEGHLVVADKDGNLVDADILPGTFVALAFDPDEEIQPHATDIRKVWEAFQSGIPVMLLDNRTNGTGLYASLNAAGYTWPAGDEMAERLTDVDDNYRPYDDSVQGYYFEGKFYDDDKHTTQIEPISGEVYHDIATDKTYLYGDETFTQVHRFIQFTTNELIKDEPAWTSRTSARPVFYRIFEPVGSATANNFDVVYGESTGTIKDDMTKKADKVSNAVQGHFAGLDASGNLTDSGAKASDFATAAQGRKADTALQEHQDISGKADKSAMDITYVEGDNTKKHIQLKNGLGTDVVVKHQDISGKAEKSEMKVTAGDGVAKVQLKAGLSVDVITDISGKQDVIDDLEDIRSGAAAGATAYQKPGSGIPKSDLDSGVQASLDKADTALQEHQDISGKADKDADAVDGNLAMFDNGNPVDSGVSKNNLVKGARIGSADPLPVDQGIIVIPESSTVNDGKLSIKVGSNSPVVFTANEADDKSVTIDKSGIGLGNVDNTSDADKPISTSTQAALDKKADKVSGATNGHLAGLNASGNLTDSGKSASDFATSAQGAKADTAYQKPAGGIPKADLDSGVQASLGKADTALQEHQDISGKANKSEMAISVVPGDDTKKTIQLKDGLSQDVVVAHQDISGKVDKVTGKDLSTNDYTDADKEKLGNIEAGAEVNVIETIKVDNVAQTVTDKTVNIDLSGKADKVVGATSGNFASLDANGNLADSGSKSADFATAAQGSLADSSVQSVSVNGGSAITPTNGNVDIPAATASTDGVMTASDKDKLDGVSDGATKVEASATNGNIVIDGTETTVYTHPTPDPAYPQYDTGLYKLAMNGTGHVIVDGNSSRRPVPVIKEDITALGIPAQDTTYEFADNYDETNNKGATVATVTNAINDLDAEVTSVDGTNVQVKVTQANGVITGVSVDTDNTLNATDIAGKADMVSGATSGNFAGLDANGNLTDSGSKAADFATAAQGTTADSAIQGVSVGSTALTPDASKVVDIPMAGYTAPDTYVAGAMSGQDKKKLDSINGYVASASVSGRVLTLTDNAGNATTFNDSGDTNVIEGVSVNGTGLTPDANKNVDITVPDAANDSTVTIDMAGTQSGTNRSVGSFTVDQASASTITIPTAVSASAGGSAQPGVMSAADKAKLDGIEAGAEENNVETISLGGGTPITPTANTTNIDIPMADFDDTGAQTTYTDGAMSGEDKEKLDKLKNFSKVTISDGASTPTTADCVPADEDDTITFVAGTNVTLTKAQNSNEVTIDAAGGTTVSAGRGVSIIEQSTATGTDYNVSVDGAVGYIGSMKTISNVTSSPADLFDASASPSINSGNDRFIIAENQTDHHVYLYALKTVKDALDPSNDVAGVDVFTLSYNVQVSRTPAHGFYGMAGVQLVRDASVSMVLHSSTESYPSNVGECSVNGTATVWNNAGTTTTIGGKDYYGYRLVYVGDTSLSSADILRVDARFSAVENMTGVTEYTGSIATYAAGEAIDIDQSNVISVKAGDGLKVDAGNNTLTVNVKQGGGIAIEQDGSLMALVLDGPTEAVVETVEQISADMDSKLTTNFPYPMITDVSYDFGSLNVGGSCICQLFAVPFRHPVVVDETYVMVYAKDSGYSQTNVMFGIYEYNPAGNNGAGQTKFICDTGAVSIAKAQTSDVLEFPIKHVNSDPDYQALRPDRMYYAVLAMPSNAGNGIFLASAPNYNAAVNSMPTLNWRMTNCSGITWNDPTNATLDETQVSWWTSGYNEHNSMNRFFMQIRNHVSPSNNGN